MDPLDRLLSRTIRAYGSQPLDRSYVPYRNLGNGIIQLAGRDGPIRRCQFLANEAPPPPTYGFTPKQF